MEEQKSIKELLSLKGKTVLITGCTRGIGEAISYRLAEAGAGLKLVDIDKDGLEQLQKNLGKVTFVEIHRVDLSIKDEIDILWENIQGSEPDILINNAGIYPFINFQNLDDKSLAKIMDINLNSVLWMCQQMINRRGDKGGVIVNISTIEAILPFTSGLIPYGLSKAGVIALSRSLAKEYGKSNFRINTILPGGINTPGTRNITGSLEKMDINPLQLGKDFVRRLPLGRYGTPDEVARVVLFLASELSSYVHGALITVDGGFLSS